MLGVPFQGLHSRRRRWAAFAPKRPVESFEPGASETENRWRGVVRDQAGGAFGAAAVPRPAGSSFMPLRRTRHRLGRATWLARRAPMSVGSGLVLRHCKRELARGPYGNVAIQDLTPAPAPGAPHTKDPASRQAGPGAGDLWGAEEHSGRGGARSALRDHSHRTCLNEEPAGRVVSCAMRPCRAHRRAVCAFSARPLHHEPAPGPACRDARQRLRHHSPITEADKGPSTSGRQLPMQLPNSPPAPSANRSRQETLTWKISM